MDDYFEMNRPSAQIAKERAKAKELRSSQWWKNIVAKGLCHYCKEKFEPAELTMDHIIPVARGGNSTKGNLVPCCKECNNAKKYLTPVEIILREAENEK